MSISNGSKIMKESKFMGTQSMVQQGKEIDVKVFLAGHDKNKTKTGEKEKPEVRQMKAIIDEYEGRLDAKVNQVISDIINHSKRNNQVKDRNGDKGEKFGSSTKIDHG